MMMTLEQMIERLNVDLSNEYAHWNFYIHAAAKVQGLHREELKEFLFKEAEGEMKHISEFKELIIGLGGDPTAETSAFHSNLVDPQKILEEALRMEDEVVSNYVNRIEDATELYNSGDKVNGKYIELFLEEQILDSRHDADNIREMVKIIA